MMRQTVYFGVPVDVLIYESPRQQDKSFSEAAWKPRE